MTERFKVVIVGTGFSGLGQAIQLEKAGIRDYVILEKATEVGGTWRDNSYPGCACDVQSHMYSFSYEQNPDWSRSFSPQPEIFDYLKGVADKYRLREKIRFGVELTGAHWDEQERRWTATTKDGREFVAQFLVSGVGGLHIPQVPELPGIAKFKGQTWHSAQWNHEYDLRGKNVAVVGTGASAVQFVPKIAPEVAELTLFQRTPPWIMPKPDHAMPSWAQTLFKRVPGTQRLYRNALYWLLEARAIGFNGHPAIMKAGELIAKRNIAKGIKDSALRKKVTPDYTMGCKRVLISNDYYPALNRPNVDVNTVRDQGGQGALDRRQRRRRARGRRDRLRHRVQGHRRAGVPRHHRGRRPQPRQGVGRRGDADPQGHHRLRLPEPVLPARPEHRAGPQLRRVHDRVAVPVRRRRHQARRLARRRGASTSGPACRTSSSRTSRTSWSRASGRRAAARAGTSTPRA